MDERLLNDLLECSVCLERLDASSKVLPCQHTFCRKCLEEIVASHSELRCPECRVLIEAKIDDLPTNVLLMRILEGMKTAEFNNQNVNKLNRTTTATNTNNKQQQPMSYQQQLQQYHQQQQFQFHHQQQLQSMDLSKIPHAKACYDFASNETSDISFKKGDIILLKKRIDHNWCYGEVNGKEGAVPINHVQVIVPLQTAQCRALYDFSMGPNEEEGCLIFKKGAIISVLRRVDQNWAEGRIGDSIGIFPITFVEMNPLAKQLMDASLKHLQIEQINTRIVPPTPAISSTAVAASIASTFDLNASDSSTTTTTTSPNSSASTTTSSNSSTAPNSPITNFQAATATAIAPPARDPKEKRHSMTAFINNSSNSNNGTSSTISSNKTVQTQSNRHSAEILSVPDFEIQSQQSHDKSISNFHHSHTTKHKNTQPALPATYIALYPYKPQKSDELELKKGSLYYVTERCQDGWFKGINRSQKSGVFPGNYVTVYKQRNDSHGSSHRSQLQQLSATSQSTSTAQTTTTTTTTTSTAAPELPPRNTNITNSKVGGQTSYIETFFGRTKSNNNETTTESTQSHTNQSSNNNKEKEKKDSSSVSFMLKNLIKRSKSPTPNTSAYSMDNPVFEDTPPTITTSNLQKNIPATTSAIHPVHVRSGSCPSQLLQNLPLDLNAVSLNIVSSTGSGGNNSQIHHHQIQQQHHHPHHHGYGGSQRTKPHKERPSMQGLRNQQQQSHQHQKDSNHHINNKQQHVQHRKSQSLDATAIASQLNNTPSKHKNHSQSVRERFRCIVPYPPNSEYELELRVGDIVLVHKKRDNGWYKGTHQRSGKTGLFPASFVEPDI
uniref:RING-type E3 ubiquitin transferase n=1 Tax=Corethrella appendiculata TaxID=1370023 RepID=U5EPL2_9DIPT